jgi:hypothetical protein
MRADPVAVRRAGFLIGQERMARLAGLGDGEERRVKHGG